MTEREDQKAMLVQWAGKLDRREAAVAAREGALSVVTRAEGS